MNHILYKTFALSTAAFLFYSNDKGWSFSSLLIPGTAARNGPGQSLLHHK